MKTKILFLVLLGMFFNVGMACDACSLYEYTSLKNRSYAAFFYNSRLFNGYDHLGYNARYTLNPSRTFQSKGTHLPELTINPTQNDYELFKTFEARLNINIDDRYNLLLVVPHRTAKVYYDEVYPTVGPQTTHEINVSGLGDVIVGIERLNNYYGDFVHRLRYGVAFKLPTGDHEKRDIHQVVYDQELQPGTGSWDFILRGTYVGIYKEKLGVSFFVNGRINTKSKIQEDPDDDEYTGYKFGNRFNVNGNIFYVVKMSDLQLVPKTGCYYESAGYDRTYEGGSQFYVNGTGGNTLFWNAGLDINYKFVTLQTLWQLPIRDNLNDTQIGNAGRLMLGLLYNFDL